jgi:hypothetical protein
MTQHSASRRRFVSKLALAATPAFATGCGGGGGGEAEANSRPAAAAPPAAPPVVSQRMTALKFEAPAAGSFVYSATLIPVRGQLPATAGLVMDDDPTFAYSVLNQWDDGSAALVVVAGTYTATAAGVGEKAVNVTLQPGTPRAALTAANLATKLSSFDVDLGECGTGRMSNFSSPERIWWANAQVICARYRVPVSGHPTLEAVLDVHLYAGGQTFVEVVVENCKINPTAVVWPTNATYTNSRLSVNGVEVSSGVGGVGTPEGVHTRHRAWYAARWLGSETTLRAMQVHTDWQAHPLLFKCVRESTFSMAAYANDAYRPWSTGRHRAVDMGAAGDSPSIGPLTQWDARLVQSGDFRAARASEASALAILSYNVNYRNSQTGEVHNFADIGQRDQQGSPPPWPRLSDALSRATWEVAHHPGAGFVAFLARPAPVFIEVAQKIAVWNGTWSGANNNFTWTSGTHGYWYQMRGRAWCLRSLVHATFLSPSNHGWRAPGQTALHNNAVLFNRWVTDPKALLNTMWDFLPDRGLVDGAGNTGFQTSMWQYHFLIGELHRAAEVRLLQGEQQALLKSVADWAAMQPVRWINEQPNGGWRYIAYQTSLGRSSTTIDSLPTWGEQTAWQYTNQPSAVAGRWYVYDGPIKTSYVDTGANGSAGAYYPSYLWAALVVAVERNLPGAQQAWATVQRDLVDLPAWLNGFATDPRWGWTPRNITS